MNYPSRKDWLGHLMLACAVFFFAFPFFIDWTDTNAPKAVPFITAIIAYSCSLLFFWIYFRTNYVIDGSDLIIRSGPIRKRIDISTITRIRSNVSSMDTGAAMKLGLAFHMLEIIYDGKAISISPIKEIEFIKQIKSVNSGIIIGTQGT